MTLQDYNAALARVAELKAQLAEAEKAVEEALPTVRTETETLRLSGSRIQLDLTGRGYWMDKGSVPRTLDELRAMADAFLPERACIGYTVADKDGDIGARHSSKEDVAKKAKEWDGQYPTLAPHRVIGLVEVEDA